MVDSAPQGRGASTPPPTGAVYITAMQRPDAALALTMLYALADQRQARVGSVCVCGAGLETAVFCDIIGRFFVPNERNGNQALAVGLAVTDPMPPNPPMVAPAVARQNAVGEPFYRRGIHRVQDTSLAEAVIRNGVIFSAESVVVLSAPATWLARTLDLLGAKAEYIKRVKRLVIVDGVPVAQDLPALRRVLAEWPTPVFVCGHNVGAALATSTTALDQAFAGFDAHPAVDAYRAFRGLPYDVPLDDLAAVHFALKPDSGLFTPSAAGSLAVASDGVIVWSPGEGAGHTLAVAADKSAEARTALLRLASATPTPPPTGRGRG